MGETGDSSEESSSLPSGVEGAGLVLSGKKETQREPSSRLQLFEGQLQKQLHQTLLSNGRQHSKCQQPLMVEVQTGLQGKVQQDGDPALEQITRRGDGLDIPECLEDSDRQVMSDLTWFC